LSLLGADLPERYHQFSQEVRLTSAPGNTIDYMLGGYFQKDYLSTDTQFNYGFLSPTLQSAPVFAGLVPYLPLGLSTLGTQHERVLSIFGSATWNVNRHIKLSAGLRASWVKKDFDWRLEFGTATNAFGNITPIPANLAAAANKIGIGTAGALGFSRQDHGLMPSAKLQYEFTPRAMAYMSYTRGFLAGGFNVADSTAIASNFPFAPEYVDAYEVGLKGEWFNRHLLTNISIFRSDYSDLQASINSVNAAGAYVSVVRNAAAARSQGVELESQAILANWFRLSTAVTYLDSKYRSYSGAGPTTAQQAAGIKTQDLSGHHTPFAPKWSGSVTGTVTAPVAGGYQLVTDLTSIFRTAFDTGIIDDPVNRNHGYMRLDGRVAIETANRRWTVELIGKNLTNRRIVIYSDPFARSLGTQAQQKEQPRNVALQVRYAW
jgi:outer membrane receptor protein involved in Fe transport